MNQANFALSPSLRNAIDNEHLKKNIFQNYTVDFFLLNWGENDSLLNVFFNI